MHRFNTPLNIQSACTVREDLLIVLHSLLRLDKGGFNVQFCCVCQHMRGWKGVSLLTNKKKGHCKRKC